MVAAGSLIPDAFSVTRTPYNTKDTPHTIHFNPSFGDGQEARWPEQGPDMSLLGEDNEKQKIWRRTAAEVIARDTGLFDNQNQHWILEKLPTGYGLFQQVTHPKPDSIAAREGGPKSKIRLDRFIFGPSCHSTRKIRSALSLGKHLSWLLFSKHGNCSCDGCKVAPPRPSSAAIGAEAGSGVKLGARKRKRTHEYEVAMAGLMEDPGDHGDEDYVEPGEGPAKPPGAKKPAAPRASAGGATASGSGSSTPSTSFGSASDPLAPVPAAAAYGAQAGPAPVAAAAAETAPSPPKKRAAAGTGRGRGRGAAKTARGGGRAAKSKKAAAAAEWEGEDEDPEGYFEEMYSLSAGEGDDDDYSEYGSTSGKVNVGARTSSGRKSRPSSKVLSGLQQEAEVVASVDDPAASMDPATQDIVDASSVVPPEQVQQDLTFPSLARVGELVWVRVPLGPPPQGALANVQLSRWPGIVRSRTIVVTGQGNVDESYRVELLGMAARDTLEGVRGENVTPWVGYIPANLKVLDGEMPADDGIKPGEEKKRWAAIQAEGWNGVAEAFKRAHRIAKAYAAIQIRPLPTLQTGYHLSADPFHPPSSLKNLMLMRARARYLSYPHLLFGPELVHLGDYVRLDPTVELDPSIEAGRSPPSDEKLPASLVMRLSGLYRSGTGSPLIARGLVFEQVEIPPPAGASSAPDSPAFWSTPTTVKPDSSLLQLPSSLVQTLPTPLPFHQWRLLIPSTASTTLSSLETDVLFHPSVAGRYYSLSLAQALAVKQDPKVVVQWLDEATCGVHWWTKQKGLGARGGPGEEGLHAMGLVLSGLSSGVRTARVEAINGLAGGRDQQLIVAEEQALLRPALPGAKAAVGADAPRPGDAQAMEVDA
ncbi:hypothetical protein JCM6882_003512 [Rhodosporidiobolus microsporus]